MAERVARSIQVQEHRTPRGALPGIRQWNTRQLATFRRYGSLFGIPLTAEIVAPLASRYAEKHCTTRPRLLQQRPVA